MSKFEKNDVKTIVCIALFICLMTAVSAVTVMAADCVYAAAKKANPLKVSGKTVKLKEDELEKKSQTIARKKVLTVKKAKGKVTYKIAKVTPAKYKKYFSMNKKTGNVTVKKGNELKLDFAEAGDYRLVTEGIDATAQDTNVFSGYIPLTVKKAESEVTPGGDDNITPDPDWESDSDSDSSAGSGGKKGGGAMDMLSLAMLSLGSLFLRRRKNKK